MRNKTAVWALLLALASLAGCESDGLSPREAAGGGQYSDLVLSLCEQPGTDATAATPAPRFSTPAKIAVAQIGEVNPPDALIEELKKHGDLFAQVQGMPGISAAERYEPQASVARRDMEQMLQFARNMGVDDLLVIGGTVDSADSPSNASVLDLTIVGVYLAPTHHVSAKGRAAAVMVDVRSGRVLFTASADNAGSRLAAAATIDGVKTRLLSDLRDKLVVELGDKLVAQAEQARTVAIQAK